MTGRTVGLALALCTVAAVGCGGGSPFGATYSCNNAQASLCIEWTTAVPLPSAQVTQLQNSCTIGGTFANGSACPTANRVGTCALPNNTGIPGVSYQYRAYLPFTAGVAQLLCTAQTGGTWTAG